MRAARGVVARVPGAGAVGVYCADEVAIRHGAAPPETTQDTELAYSHLPRSRETRYRNGRLPE